MNLIQSPNKHLLSNLAAILTPVKQGGHRAGVTRASPPCSWWAPTYVRLEKLFTATQPRRHREQAVPPLPGGAHENFKVHPAHKVAMILDPQQKLRPVPPTHSTQEIIGKVCEPYQRGQGVLD